MKALTALTAVLLATATPVLADSITVGLWDAANPGVGIVPILSSPDGSFVYRKYNSGDPTNLGANFAGNVGTLTLAPDAAGSVYREAAFDDIFNTGVSDTIRLFYSFQGVTAGSTNLTFPAIFQAGANGEPIPPGTVIAEQIFTCANGATFCDNNLVGGGTLLGMQVFGAGSATIFDTFSATVPGNPFNLDFVFTIASSGGAPSDFSAAILTQPDVTVPGPIAGAGIPGLAAGIFGLWGWWRRRCVALSVLPRRAG